MKRTRKREEMEQNSSLAFRRILEGSSYIIIIKAGCSHGQNAEICLSDSFSRIQKVWPPLIDRPPSRLFLALFVSLADGLPNGSGYRPSQGVLRFRYP